MTNGSQQSHGGFEPPRHPGQKNDLDPRLVEKMSQELEECQSLKEEIRGQQQRAPRQAPARCQPATDNNTTKHLGRIINQKQKISELCYFIEDILTTCHTVNINSPYGGVCLYNIIKRLPTLKVQREHLLQLCKQ